MKAKISEIFKSLQGEGIYQGRPQVFVRFYGCNLDCSYCDTKLISYEEKEVDDVFRQIAGYDGYGAVALTGGEPLLQAGVLKVLAKKIQDSGKKVYLETNGTSPDNLKEIIDCVDMISMDFKLPSSGGGRSFWDEHQEFLKVALGKEVFVKAVVGPNTQITDISRAVEILNTLNAKIPFVLQPQNPYEDILGPKLLFFQSFCRMHGVDVRVIAQIHKKLGIK
jgi:organic radical activating enzyme